jgi:hypothetical protein
LVTNQSAVSVSVGGMVYPGLGIGNSTGSGWGTSYDATNKIPATFISTLNQNTTGTASNLSGTPPLPNGTTATTQTVGDNSTKIATTAFVLANAPTYTLPQATTSVLGGVKPDGTTCTTSSGVLTCPGSGSISGLTTGYLTQAASATSIANSFINYGVTNAGAYTSTKDIYAPHFHTTDTSGAGFGFGGGEGTAPGGASGVDGLWADSTAHRWSMNNNNAGAVKVVGIGTAATSGHVAIFSSNGLDIQDLGTVGITASGTSCTITAMIDGVITGATCTP